MQEIELNDRLQQIKSTRERLINAKIKARARRQEGINALKAVLEQFQAAGEIESLQEWGQKDVPGVQFVPTGAVEFMRVYCTDATIGHAALGDYLACEYQVEAKQTSHHLKGQVQEQVLYTGQGTILDELPKMIGELQADAF